VQLRLRVTTAIQTGKNAFLDHVALTPAQQQYNGGPWFQFFNGSIAFSGDDLFEVTVNNNLAGLWQIGFQQLFGMSDLGLILPSAGSTLINNSLIV
jgi:ligand-binding sensor domain-containing protein